MKKTLPERFWGRVIKQENGCWEYTGSLTHNGYGDLSISYGERRAHRYSWVLHHGLPVPEETLVLHSCDNRKCVNPDHLFLGTEKDNTKDMYEKGRQINPGPICPVRGEKHPNCKVSEEIVSQIRSRYKPFQLGLTKNLAKEFGLSTAQILNIATGRRRTPLQSMEN